MRKEIESRLIALCVGANQFVLGLSKTTLSINLGDQMIRSATSAALNYGEAQGAESRKDFIHKASLVLKELRETGISLRIFYDAGIRSKSSNLDELMDECNQLTAIFQKTVTTARTKRTEG